MIFLSPTMSSNDLCSRLLGYVITQRCAQIEFSRDFRLESPRARPKIRDLESCHEMQSMHI